MIETIVQPVINNSDCVVQSSTKISLEYKTDFQEWVETSLSNLSQVADK